MIFPQFSHFPLSQLPHPTGVGKVGKLMGFPMGNFGKVWESGKVRVGKSKEKGHRTPWN